MTPEGVDQDGYMLPPWLALPLIDKGSIGWRMGVGEGYLDSFSIWWSGQSSDVRLLVRETYGEPLEWLGFWNSLG